MEEILRRILNDLKEMRRDMNGMKYDISELKQGQIRIEVGQGKLQQNLVDGLGLYTGKIADHVDIKTEVLNNWVKK